MSTIELNNIWEKYRIKFINEEKVSWEEFLALEDISLQVNRGEVLGVIGQNGAGKTTLLKLIAGMLIPDKGKINVAGRVSVLMELGAGFNPEFTGRENITLNARMYGLDEDILEQQIDKIVEFADLGRFIDAPIKYYSQGMYMRLAFALAIFVEPDILLIDDILAVGDEEAQQKCIKKIFELKQSSKTIILVSHDMNMISKLCNRVILLEKGRIVREGLPSKVIPYYLELVGDKKGIAVLEKGKLRVIFNNGRISLSYDGDLLTKGMGGYSSFFIPSINSWFSSFNLSWQIKNFSSDKIVAEGFSQDGVISEIWLLQLQQEGLRWQVEIKEEAIKEPHLDLIFIPQYKKWLTLEKEENFPLFIHKSNWQDLGLNNPPEGVLGIGPDLENFLLPNIILNIEDRVKLFNSGYEQEARIIQTYLNSSNFISLEINIFSNRDRFEDYINNMKHQLLLKQKEKENRILNQRTISSGNLHLFADLENKAIRLYYKDREITKGNGLYSSFRVLQKWFNLGDAQWKIQKVSEEELILIINYEPLSLCQIWTLICNEENILKIKIELEVDKPIFLINYDVRLELQDRYKNWLTAYEGGSFLTNQYISDIAPIRLKNSKVSKVILKSEIDSFFHQLFFENTSETGKYIFSIYKCKREEGYPSLNFSLIISKKEALINPGRYTYFKGRIGLDKDISLKETDLDRGIELNKGNLKFIFDQGRGRLFWKKKELTTGLGIYSSVRSLGIWYDSSQAVWTLNQINDNKIVVCGDWPYIYISQIWQIELINENSVLLVGDMEIFEETTLEIEQMNLMLSSGYKIWVVPGINKGKFLDEFTSDYDIFPFRYWYGKSLQQELRAIGENLPLVSFTCNLENKLLRAIVENTDYLYKARLLQYQKRNTAKLLPKKYRYFEGVIKIGTQD